MAFENGRGSKETVKHSRTGAGKMVQRARVLNALAEDQGSGSNTQACDAISRHSGALFWPLRGPTHTWYTHAYT